MVNFIHRDPTSDNYRVSLITCNNVNATVSHSEYTSFIRDLLYNDNRIMESYIRGICVAPLIAILDADV